MKRKLDVTEVDAALQRAAYRAIHGTRAERSGRFLPTKKDNVSQASRASKRTDASRRKA